MNGIIQLSLPVIAGGIAPGSTQGNGIAQMAASAGPMVQFILGGLFCLSVACWCIIVLKVHLIRRAREQSRQFMGLFRQSASHTVLYRESEPFEDSHIAELFRIGYEELARLNKSIATCRVPDSNTGAGILLESVERAMQGGMAVEKRRFEQHLSFLATTGSAAPFIGLFGTVWGIMTSFQEIGMKGTANLAVVAPGISEALIATAMGLAAAIPAVVAYNHLSNRVKNMENEMDEFATDYLNVLKRNLLRKEAPEGKVDG